MWWANRSEAQSTCQYTLSDNVDDLLESMTRTVERRQDSLCHKVSQSENRSIALSQPRPIIVGAMMTFQSLPPEIRNRTYDILFQQRLRIVLGEKTSLELDDVCCSRQGSQLLETCHQVYKEARSFAYRDVNVKMGLGYCIFDLEKLAQFHYFVYNRELVINEQSSQPMAFRRRQKC